MCKVLQIPRSTYYYESKPKKDESQLVTDIIGIFRRSRNNYGTRKIKQELRRMGQIVSRRRNWSYHETGSISIKLHRGSI